MTPKKLDPEVVSILLPRLQDEYDAAYFYRSASNWLQNVGYFNAAKYFSEESNDELSHAKGIEDYLSSWNVIPNLPAIDKPVLKFDGLVDIINQAYEIEYTLFGAYNDGSTQVFKKGDIATFDFLQKYRTIQNSSVAEYSDFLNQLALIDSKDKFQVFYWENNAFKK